MAIDSIDQFVLKLESFMLTRKEVFYVYTGKKESGSLMLKSEISGKRYLIGQSFSIHPIGAVKIEKYSLRQPTFKGRIVDNYIYVAGDYKDNAKRLPKINRQISLLSFSANNKSMTLYGSMNLESELLLAFIEFANYSKLSISYDFEGLLQHKGFDEKQALTKIEKRQNNPKVFFSYSWDSVDHKLWVLNLSADLIKNGVDVLVDEWDLRRYKNDLHYFMESGIREADKVVIVCTPTYALKANERRGGVGVENTIITGEYYDGEKASKYIPIVLNYSKSHAECLPTYLKTKLAIDFNDENDYSDNLDDLIRRILDVPKYRKPSLGKLPTNLTKDL